LIIKDYSVFAISIENQRKPVKKIFLALVCLAAASTLVHAQSYMEINGIIADVTSNTSSFYDQDVGPYVTGETSSGTVAWYYAVLVSAIPITDGATDPGWTQVGLFSTGNPIVAGGSDLIAGGIFYNDGNLFQSTIPVGKYYVEVVGWSPDLGSTWSSVEGQLASADWSQPGYFGETYSGTADFMTAAEEPGDNCFGVTGVANGSLVLYAVGCPEPTTLALASLGGLSMLFLRRRKA
jgi:hypothetical protein